jgi:hypothetical protein
MRIHTIYIYIQNIQMRIHTQKKSTITHLAGKERELSVSMTAHGRAARDDPHQTAVLKVGVL